MPRFTPIAALLALTLAAALPARAEEAYPARPITMIVPFAAGGTSDVIARIVAEAMARSLGQRIIHENVGGAGGTVALARAARAAPDGYTIFIGNSGTNAAAYAIYPDIRYTPESFAPIGLIAKTNSMIALRADHPATTLAALVAEAKAKPGTIRLGHAGVGSQNYLICRAFMEAAGVDVTLVSYRGAGPALNDLMGGHVDGVCDAATSVGQAINAGRIRGLAVASPSRVPGLEGVPTAAEAGLPAFQMQNWNALFAPAGTPPAVIARLNRAIAEALESPDLKKRYAELMASAPGTDERAPEAVTPLVANDIVRFRRLMGPKP